jgi:hypothetical protein
MISLIALVGCEEGPSFLKPSEKTDAAASHTVPKVTKGETRDVESPDVFQITSKGLWDGRPSLGGIWVAHPDVTQPERVIIRNTSNSKSVVGALFRRERNNPGPVFQLSSDAADALGILAGAPAVLSVTALKKEAPPPTPEVEPAEKSKPQPSKSAETKPEKVPAKPLKDTNTIEATALAPVDGAAAAIGAAEVANAAAASSGGVTPEVTQPATSPLQKPYIQVGIFSVKDNAENAASDLREKGFQSSVRELKGQNKTLWRVVVGPASSKPERSALLKKVKGVGFNDAYPVRN